MTDVPERARLRAEPREDPPDAPRFDPIAPPPLPEADRNIGRRSSYLRSAPSWLDRSGTPPHGADGGNGSARTASEQHAAPQPHGTPEDPDSAEPSDPDSATLFPASHDDESALEVHSALVRDLLGDGPSEPSPGPLADAAHRTDTDPDDRADNVWSPDEPHWSSGDDRDAETATTDPAVGDVSLPTPTPTGEFAIDLDDPSAEASPDDGASGTSDLGAGSPTETTTNDRWSLQTDTDDELEHHVGSALTDRGLRLRVPPRLPGSIPSAAERPLLPGPPPRAARHGAPSGDESDRAVSPPAAVIDLRTHSGDTHGLDDPSSIVDDGHETTDDEHRPEADPIGPHETTDLIDLRDDVGADAEAIDDDPAIALVEEPGDEEETSSSFASSPESNAGVDNGATRARTSTRSRRAVPTPVVAPSRDDTDDDHSEVAPLTEPRRRRWGWGWLAGIALGCALVLVVVAALLVVSELRNRGDATSSPSNDPSGPSADLTEDIATRFGDAVYRVQSSGCGVEGNGTAFAITPNHLVTNRHVVVNDTTPILLNRHNDTEGALAARVIGWFEDPDIAVLEVDKALEPVLTFADPSKLSEGQQIVALGYPLPAHDFSVNSGGIVSFPDGEREMLRTDAPLDKGNSGGPAFIRTGEVAGIVTEMEFKEPAFQPLVLILTRNAVTDAIDTVIANPAMIEANCDETPYLPEPPEDIQLSILDLAPAHCYDDASTDEGNVEAVILRECNAPHESEAYYQFDVAGDDAASFPGTDKLAEVASAECLRQFTDYVGISAQASTLQVWHYFPTEDSWTQGDRSILCSLRHLDGELLTRSMRSARL